MFVVIIDLINLSHTIFSPVVLYPDEPKGAGIKLLILHSTQVS